MDPTLLILFPDPPASIKSFEIELLDGPNAVSEVAPDISMEPEKLTRTSSPSSTKWTMMTAIVDCARRSELRARSNLLESVFGRWNDDVEFIYGSSFYLEF